MITTQQNFAPPHSTGQAQEQKPLDQQAQPYLSVIIPAYNEESRLPATMTKVLTYLEGQPYKFELIIVDDGSSDETAAVAEEIAQDHPRARVIRNDHRGKAYTVRTGMLLGEGKYLLFSDADLAVPIEESEKILPYLEEGYDVVIASREGQGARRIGEPAYRHIMGRGFNFIIQMIALGGFQDTQCGFKAFTREAARDLFNQVQLYGADAKRLSEAAVTGFDVEILFLAVKRGYRTKEVPVRWTYGTETKVNPLKDTWRNLKDVIKVRWYDLTGRYNNHRE